MQLLNFVEAVNLVDKPETERAKLLCFYYFKETGNSLFKMSSIATWMEECGFSKPNISRLGIPARVSKKFEAFREVGNNSAHSITYTAGKLDIDNISRDYRVMMEDLYNRAGLI